MVALNVDRELLFGVIALQDDLIDQRQFADVCAGWALEMDRSLGEMLVSRGWLTAKDRLDVEQKLERKLKKHRGDIRATLGAVTGAAVRGLIQQVDNPRVQRSLDGLPPSTGQPLAPTLVGPGDDRDSLRYTLTRVHAEGGLGKIWIARDTDLNREVALKEIRGEKSASPDAQKRFLREAQITGQLEHPNIVPVYELARRPEDDQPFYTMRFIRGRTMRQAIGEFHLERGRRPIDRLALQKELLEPFIKVCQAIGYAHARDVVHRDLKPENIVLGSHGEAILLDWGLAKTLGLSDESSQEEARITVTSEAQTLETQGAVGTPAYMAPEQVEGRKDGIDARTDVYGLGGVLYEILTGHPPAEGESVGEVFQKILHGNIPGARTHDPTIPRPLEAICAKALARIRGDRYASAEELAEDVRRWLLDEPVSVYRDPAHVQLMRWARRHKSLVASLAALMLTITAALSIGIILIRGEQKKTETQRTLAVRNAEQALGNLRLAQNATDELLAEVADVELADVPQMEPVRRRLLEKARAGYEQFLAQKGDDPVLRWGAGRSLARLGDIQELLGKSELAEDSYQKAIELLDALTKRDSTSIDYRRDLARSWQGYGLMLKNAGRFREAETAFRTAIALRETTTESPEDRQGLADSQYHLGAVLARRATRRADDEKVYQAVLATQRALVEEYRDRPEMRTRLARYLNNHAMLERALGHNKEAESSLAETMKLMEPWLTGPQALPGARWQWGRAANNLATIRIVQGSLDEAVSLLARAREILTALTSEFPSIPAYRQELGVVHYNLGLAAARAGSAQTAALAYRNAANLLEALVRDYPGVPAYKLRYSMALLALNEMLAASNPEAADREIRRAIDEQAALVATYDDVPEYQSILGRSYYQLAKHRLDRNPSANVVSEAEKALALHQEVVEEQPDSRIERINLLEDRRVLALALLATRQPARALEQAQAAAAELLKLEPLDFVLHFEVAALIVRCAAAVEASGDAASAAAGFERAMSVLRDAFEHDLVDFPGALDIEEFEPLRKREDFEKLRNRLPASAPAVG
jgi:serine/threonine protein kinase